MIFHKPFFFRADEGEKVTIKPRTKGLVKPEEEKLFCKNCGQWITSGPWRIAVNGEHEHIFFNPAGVVFKIGCFKEAPGTIRVGKSSDEFTWFRNHVWQIVICNECETHLGWFFSEAKMSSVFFGLILPKLTSKKLL
ncbi:MAG: cereblon family protein [Rhodospirillales bacterium]|nr:cereblon family protein [Rhodospirillales bacterium]